VDSGVPLLSDTELPKPPFLGSRVVKGIPLADIARYINETALFRNQWQYRPGGRSTAEYEELLNTTARPRLRALLDEGRQAGWFEPAVVYGYFRAARDGNAVVIYGDDGRTERARLTFPRQREDRRLCLADYVRPPGRDGAAADHVAFHIVTVGRRVSEETLRLFEEDRYQEYLHLHGLGVELAEALAEYWHARVREEWGIGGTDAKTMAGLFRQDYRGCRYSFGYPACPNLEDQAVLWPLLEPGRIGVSLTEEFQLEPEQSTSALIMHHPDAGYFIVR
jgi:5-methyltetrahydrofolate--homocysteine methyltransferase